jgi:hypothetical protein
VKRQGEVHQAIDWVENAFGDLDAQIAGWHPSNWLKAAAGMIATRRFFAS